MSDEPNGSKPDASPERTRQVRYFWTRPVRQGGKGGGPMDGAALAALRRGIGREPGTVPQMWPYYTTLTGEGRLTPKLQAEHVALTLFAVHQQSKSRLMHEDGVGLGTALQHLRDDPAGRANPQALDRRFSAAATASSTTELELHLRGLVALLRENAKGGQPLDYTQLVEDLVAWQRPDGAARIRRKWGGQYFAPLRPKKDEGEDGAPASESGAAAE